MVDPSSSRIVQGDMGFIAQKFIACVMLLAVVVFNANCFCAAPESKHWSAEAHGITSDPHSNEHDEHDQDHQQHESCLCGSNFVLATDNPVSFQLKHASMPALLVLVDPQWLQSLNSPPQAIGSGFNAHTPHPPSAVTALLRLHCALIV